MSIKNPTNNMKPGLALQWYIFPWYDTYLDTRATVRYMKRYITVHDKTSYQQLTLLLDNLFP